MNNNEMQHLFQSNNQYQILLHWSSGQSAKMNILIVHATVIILAYGPPEGCFYTDFVH